MENVFKVQTWIDKFGEDQLNINELRSYLKFVQEAEITRDPARYSEWHHVMPKCIDKDQKYVRYVNLNGADHFRAHLKLVECFIRGTYYHRLLTYPLNQMRKSSRIEGLSSEEYEKGKELFSKSQLGVNNPACKEEVRLKISRSRLGKVHITDGLHERLINPSEELPEGWRRGQSVSHNINSGEAQRDREFSDISRSKMSKSRSEGNKGRRWITNGIINSFIKFDEDIPEGWRLGRTVSDTTRLKVHDNSSGRVKINNGVVTKFIKSGENIPEGYVLGGLTSPTLGKIRITNGQSNKCISQDEDIPDGWWRGMTQYCKEVG